MSYEPRSFEVSSMSAVFCAHSSQKQVISIGNTFSFDSSSESIKLVNGKIKTYRNKAYCVGEIRSDGDPNEESVSEIEISENTGELSQGYQINNNAAVTVAMDDACYGVVNGSNINIEVTTTFNGSEGRSEAFETRLIGVYTS